MTTASREDHFGKIGRGSDPGLRARRVGHREMSYPGRTGASLLGGSAQLGLARWGPGSEEKQKETSALRNPIRPSRGDSSRGGLTRLHLGFHPLHGEAHQTCRVLQLQLLFEMLAV